MLRKMLQDFGKISLWMENGCMSRKEGKLRKRAGRDNIYVSSCHALYVHSFISFSKQPTLKIALWSC